MKENSNSTERWNDVPRGAMDEVSSYVRLDLSSVRRQGRAAHHHAFRRMLLR
jgi:hypothetical protein